MASRHHIKELLKPKKNIGGYLTHKGGYFRVSSFMLRDTEVIATNGFVQKKQTTICKASNTLFFVSNRPTIGTKIY